jgi:isopentenyl phosphate kinase
MPTRMESGIKTKIKIITLVKSKVKIIIFNGVKSNRIYNQSNGTIGRIGPSVT